MNEQERVMIVGMTSEGKRQRMERLMHKHISEIKAGDVINMQGIWTEVLDIKPDVTSWGQRCLKMNTRTVVDGAPLTCWHYGNIMLEVREASDELTAHTPPAGELSA